MAFSSNYIFGLISDFWQIFEDRPDLENAWDGHLQKAEAMTLLARQAGFSKSLATIPLFDKDELRYFDFSKLERVPTLETNNAFYVFKVDEDIFFIREFHEAIDGIGKAQRILVSPRDFEVDAGILKFKRGVQPTGIGATSWLQGSENVTGTGIGDKVVVGDIIQAPNANFFKIIEVVDSDTLTITGKTVFGEDLGPGDGILDTFPLATTSFVNDATSGAGEIQVFFDGVQQDSGGGVNFSVTAAGVLTFATPPGSNVQSITVNYFSTYPGTDASIVNTTKESLPVRLLTRSLFIDRRSIFTNFGIAVNHDKPTSLQYLNEVRGIYFARWKGPTPFAMSLGGGILTGIPFAERGTVRRVATTSPKQVVVDDQILDIPDSLNITVNVGDQLTEDFNLVTDGIRTADYINDPELFNLEPLKSDPARYFTFFLIVSGSYAVEVATETGQPIDYTAIKQFKLDVKPTYTDCMVLTDIDFIEDGLNFFIGAVDVTNLMVAESTLEFNCLNFAIIPEFLTNNGFADEAALLASGLCDMDSDAIALVEDVAPISDCVFISTLENNLVNFGVSPPGTEDMDLNTIPFTESMDINEAEGTPPGSFIPPFTAGALIYSF